MENKIKELKLSRTAGWVLIYSAITLGLFGIGRESLEYDLFGKIIFYSLTIIFCLNIPTLVALPRDRTTNILLLIGLFLLSANVLLYDLYTWILFSVTVVSVYLYSRYKRLELLNDANYATAYRCFFRSKATPFFAAMLVVFTILYFMMFSFFEIPFKILNQF